MLQRVHKNGMNSALQAAIAEAAVVKRRARMDASGATPLSQGWLATHCWAVVLIVLEADITVGRELWDARHYRKTKRHGLKR